MKRIRTIRRAFALASLLSLVLVPGAMAGLYSWSLSFSDTDPQVNAGPSLPVVGEVYLWLFCSDEGAAAFSAEFTATNGAFLAAFTPVPGVSFTGILPSPQLVLGGCPSGPFLVGSFTVIGVDTDICLENAITVDCDPVDPMGWPSGVIGASAGGGTVCELGNVFCEGPVSTRENSWGSVKGLYR